jgi:hypothetical protein
MSSFVGTPEEIIFPICNKCDRYFADGTCSAFPDGIPDEIMNGFNNHSAPYPGDRGFQFVAKGGKA